MGTFTMRASTFKSRLNDVSTLSDMSQVLWKELVKPCAAKQAGIPRYEMKVKPEGSLVWQEIMKHPSLADKCKHIVEQEDASYTAFAAERLRIANVFHQLCVRPLEHVFIRPLLLSLGRLDEFVDTAFELPGIASVETKLDALFVNHPASFRLCQGIVEHCGVSNFEVLLAKVADIASSMPWSEEAQHVFAFGELLHSAPRFMYPMW